MGRQSRQARRAQMRRQQLQAERGPRASVGGRTPARGGSRIGPRNTSMWSLIAGAAVVLAAIILFILSAAGVFKGGTSNASSSTPTFSNGPSVGPIHCDQGMTSSNSYHVHAHLTIINKGKPETISPDFGHFINDDCLYWVHAHQDVNGIIHIESPNAVHPTIAEWYQIAKNTLPSDGDKLPQIKPAAGEQERVWVDMKPYHGNPMQIKLYRHTDVTIEFGPPWVAPKKFTFPANL